MRNYLQKEAKLKEFYNKNKELIDRLGMDALIGLKGTLLYELIQRARGKSTSWTGRGVSFLGGVGLAEVMRSIVNTNKKLNISADKVSKNSENASKESNNSGEGQKDTSLVNTSKKNDAVEEKIRDHYGNVVFPGYTNIYDSQGNIIKYKHDLLSPSNKHPKNTDPISKPFTMSSLLNYVKGSGTSYVVSAIDPKKAYLLKATTKEVK